MKKAILVMTYGTPEDYTFEGVYLLGNILFQKLFLHPTTILFTQ